MDNSIDKKIPIGNAASRKTTFPKILQRKKWISEDFITSNSKRYLSKTFPLPVPEPFCHQQRLYIYP